MRAVTNTTAAARVASRRTMRSLPRGTKKSKKVTSAGTNRMIKRGFIVRRSPHRTLIWARIARSKMTAPTTKEVT